MQHRRGRGCTDTGSIYPQGMTSKYGLVSWRAMPTTTPLWVQWPEACWGWSKAGLSKRTRWPVISVSRWGEAVCGGRVRGPGEEAVYRWMARIQWERESDSFSLYSVAQHLDTEAGQAVSHLFLLLFFLLLFLAHCAALDLASIY